MFTDLIKKIESKKFSTVPKHVNLWARLAQILPSIALATLGLLYVFDVADAIHLMWLTIALTFALIAVTWWWWVIYAIKDVHNIMHTTNETFLEITKELKKLQQDIKEAQELNLSRSKTNPRKQKTSK